MRIALASPRVAASVADGLDRVDRLMGDAAAQGAGIVCFPEAYLPGLRGLDFTVPAFDAAQQNRVLQAVADMARARRIAVIAGLERITDRGRQIASVVVEADGTIRGWQTKNQLDPSEEANYLPGRGRQLFEIGGLRFGVTICHEGFRYPETVRWAAQRGAKIVFHPHCTGSDRSGAQLRQWGSSAAPYYERAMMCRALENTVYFAGVNYAFRYQDSATAFISPAGECVAHLPYGEEGVLVRELDLRAATGLLAARFAPERHGDSGAG